MFRSLIGELGGELGAAAVELLVIGALLLIVVVLAIPLALVMKKFNLGPKHWRRDTTLMEDIREAREWRGPTLEEYGRNSFVKGLAVHRDLLWFVLIGEQAQNTWWPMTTLRGNNSNAAS